ncbi:MAG TPA: HAMP domain-containing protein, partial [Kofleriaceae bacterium]|nr:HAMP domain-containing protein [Kofleriaceae bacterium]
MATTTSTNPPRKNGQRDAPPVQLGRRDILAGLRALKRGEFSVRLPDSLEGVDGQICETFNEVAQLAESLERELAELRTGVGHEGRTRLRLKRGGRGGGWRNATDAVNDLLDDVIAKGDDVASVLEAIGRGDFSKSIAEEGAETPLRGQFLRHARIVNGLVSQLAQLNSELTRVARQVGVDGKLGAQAQLPAMGGAWRDLTDAVNLMASNLTLQVREIARVTTAVAQGDLTKSINIDARGEILELKNTMNTMIDQLGSFADEVTRVARE